MCSEVCYLALPSRPRGPAPIPLADRFYDKVSRDGPLPESHPEYGNCHDWTAALNPNGYGMIGRSGRGTAPLGAHVAAWMLATGGEALPDGAMIGHTCDRRVCVRNDEAGIYVVRGVESPRFGHLWLGNDELNTWDMIDKGRAAWQSDLSLIGYARGDRHWMHQRPNDVLRGEAKTLSKLTDQRVREIRERYAAGESKASLGRAFDVSDSLIRAVVFRRIWTHVQ